MSTSAGIGDGSSLDDRVVGAARRLKAAADSKTPCAPVRDLLGADALRLAYAVQRRNITSRLAAGARIAGHKVGLTSHLVQQQLGVDQPDYGLLLDDMQFASGDVIDIDLLLQPRVEAEIAFILAADITDPDLTTTGIRSLVSHIVAVLEVVDSRIADWDITLADTVADNASSGLFVLGAHRASLSDFHPFDAVMTMTIDGRTASSGTGDACLGDPLNALLWLARTAIEHDDPLRAGHVVLSGALGPMVPVLPGAHVEATISGLGSVQASFTNDPDLPGTSKLAGAELSR